MIGNGKKILVTTEKHEIFILRQNGHAAIQGFCPLCERDVDMLPLDLAITVSGIRGRDLIRDSENGRFHSVETTAGHLLICKTSLARDK